MNVTDNFMTTQRGPWLVVIMVTLGPAGLRESGPSPSPPWVFPNTDIVPGSHGSGPSFRHLEWSDNKLISSSKSNYRRSYRYHKEEWVFAQRLSFQLDTHIPFRTPGMFQLGSQSQLPANVHLWRQQVMAQVSDSCHLLERHDLSSSSQL